MRVRLDQRGSTGQVGAGRSGVGLLRPALNELSERV